MKAINKGSKFFTSTSLYKNLSEYVPLMKNISKVGEVELLI